MANLTITAASVIASAAAQKENGTAGASITAGQAVYRDSADEKYKLADTNSATAAARSPRGIALHAAGDGQPLAIVRSGPVTIGASLTKGQGYYLSGTAGGICPYADLTTGDYPVLLGIATSTTVLDIDIKEVGSAL